MSGGLTHLRRLPGVVLAILAFAVGCTGTTAEGGEPPLGAIVAIRNAEQIVFPLDDYDLDNTSLEQGLLAGEYLIRDCMERFGLSWTVRVSPPSTSVRYARRYGVLDAKQVAVLGYHAPRGHDPKPSTPGGPLSADQQAVLTGTGVSTFNGVPIPAGGCSGEGSRILLEGAPHVGDIGQVGLPTRLGSAANARAEKDSRVLAAWSAWSECMRRSGFDYSGPWAAQNDPSWWQGSVISEREIATAKADVACREETNLVGIWYAVEVAYQNRAIEENADELANWKVYREAYARNVAKVLAGG